MSHHSLTLHQPHHALNTPMLRVFYFLNTTFLTPLPSRNWGHQNSPVGNGGTALGPVSGPCSLAEDMYHAEKPAEVGATLCQASNWALGQPRQLQGVRLIVFIVQMAGDTWIMDCRVHIVRAEVPHDKSDQPNQYFPSKFPVNELCGSFSSSKQIKYQKSLVTSSYQCMSLWLFHSLKSITE